MTELEHYTPGAHLNQTTDSWTLVLADVADLAQKIADTDFVPDSFRRSVPAVAATILYGREVGLGPMQSLASLHNIKGKVGMSAEAMRALVLQAGHEIVVVESTSARVTVKGRRHGSEEWSHVTWTIDDARQAKLGGDNWTKYPRAMLAARATAELCRLIFADAIHGLMATEELDDGQVPADAGPAQQPRTTSTVQRKPRPAPEPAPPPLTAVQDPPLPDTPPPPTEPQNGAQPPLEPEPDRPPTPAGDNASHQQQALLFAQLGRLDLVDRDKRLQVTGRIIGRDITTYKQLTADEASQVIDTLATVKDRDQLDDILTTVEP